MGDVRVPTVGRIGCERHASLTTHDYSDDNRTAGHLPANGHPHNGVVETNASLIGSCRSVRWPGRTTEQNCEMRPNGGRASGWVFALVQFPKPSTYIVQIPVHLSTTCSSNVTYYVNHEHSPYKGAKPSNGRQLKNYC